MQRDKSVGLSANCILVRRDGYESAIEDSAAPIHDRDGQITGAVVVFHDVSMARAMVLEMSHLAQHDVLTDLPNRLLLKDRLTQAISLACRNHNQLALLFLDLRVAGLVGCGFRPSARYEPVRSSGYASGIS